MDNRGADFRWVGSNRVMCADCAEVFEVSRDSFARWNFCPACGKKIVNTDLDRSGDSTRGCSEEGKG